MPKEAGPFPRGDVLTARFLLLSLQKGVKANAINSVYLIASSRKIAVRLTFGSSNAFNLHLIVLINEVQSSISGQKGGYDLSILNQLCTNALSNRTVRLTALHSYFFQNNCRTLRCSL